MALGKLLDFLEPRDSSHTGGYQAGLARLPPGAPRGFKIEDVGLSTGERHARCRVNAGGCSWKNKAFRQDSTVHIWP